MKRINIPDFQKKQYILHINRTTAKDLVAYGDRCLEVGRISEALDFYLGANHTAGLERVREISGSAGDVMLFQQVMKALGRLVTEEDWDRIGRKALSLKKYAFSLHAFEKNGDAPMCDQIREIIRTGGNGQVS